MSQGIEALNKYKSLKNEFLEKYDFFKKCYSSEKWVGSAESKFEDCVEKIADLFKTSLNVKCTLGAFEKLEKLISKLDSDSLDDESFYEMKDLLAEARGYYNDYLFKKNAYDSFDEAFKVLEKIYAIAEYIMVIQPVNPLNWRNPDFYSTYGKEDLQEFVYVLFMAMDELTPKDVERNM